MGSSQSRSNDPKRLSRVGDQLKSVLRRPNPSAQENNEDDSDAKPHSVAAVEQEITNGNHDEPSTSETVQKEPSTTVCVFCVLFVAVLFVTSLSATTTCLYASYCSLSSNTHLFPFNFHLKLIILKYRTGKTLGSGTYAIVKEAIHVETGKYFACKVINKKLMEGREHMVGLSFFLFFLKKTIAHPFLHFFFRMNQIKSGPQ